MTEVGVGRLEAGPRIEVQGLKEGGETLGIAGTILVLEFERPVLVDYVTMDGESPHGEEHYIVCTWTEGEHEWREPDGCVIKVGLVREEA